MPGRPSKPTKLIVLEGNKDHRTKEELALREKAEAALLTGRHMQAWPEVVKDRVALEEFNRVRELLEIIGKDDALHESIINRYALIRSECLRFERQIKSLRGDLIRLSQAYKKKELDFLAYADAKQRIIGNMVSYDKQIQAKRNMLLAIEKENIMTIASALRSIPKKTPKEEKKPGIKDFVRRQADPHGEQS